MNGIMSTRDINRAFHWSPINPLSQQPSDPSIIGSMEWIDIAQTFWHCYDWILKVTIFCLGICQQYGHAEFPDQYFAKLSFFHRTFCKNFDANESPFVFFVPVLRLKSLRAWWWKWVPCSTGCKMDICFYGWSIIFINKTKNKSWTVGPSNQPIQVDRAC